MSASLETMRMNHEVEMKGLLESEEDEFDDDGYFHYQGGGRVKPYDEPSHRTMNSLKPELLQNDVEQNDMQDMFFSTLDKLEDDFDEQAYEELIPLNIRMALENRLFGWTNLCADIFGHIFYTVSSYASAFWAVSILGLKEIHKSCNDIGQCAKEMCDLMCMLHKPFYAAGDQTGRLYQFAPILDIAPQLFVIIRILISLSSAINTFRVVRRRRKVWLRYSVGEVEFFKYIKQRKQAMEETDRNSLLGRIRGGLRKRKDVWLNKRIHKKISKAKKRFSKRQERREKSFLKSSSVYESDHHNRVKQLITQSTADLSIDASCQDSERSRSSRLFSIDGNVMLLSPSQMRSERIRSPTNGELDPDDFLSIYQKCENHDESNHQTDHFYGHTMPIEAMKSIALDQIPFKSGMIQNVPYAHGGFFGAAPFMLANPHWIEILRQLMPDVYVEISRRVVRTPAPQLIHWAENNPVVAAYGTAHEIEYVGKLPTLEWDVFLDPHLVQRVEVVVEARDKFFDMIQSSYEMMKSVCKDFRNRKKVLGISSMDSILTMLQPNDRTILQFYNTEIEKRVNLLMETMLIAHGNASQLALEQTGVLKRYNFSRVKHTRRTLGGGIYAKHWITVFAEALQIGTEVDDGGDSSSEDESSLSDGGPKELKHSLSDESSPLLHNKESIESSDSESDGKLMREKSSISPSKAKDECRLESIKSSTSFRDLALAACPPSDIYQSITMLKRILKCEAPLGLVLDIKSRHVPKRVWALIIDALRQSGARVEGIASFFVEEIRDISQLCSAPVNEIIFFHSAGDMQSACHDALINPGDQVFFNAGSLFWNSLLNDGDSSPLCASFDVEKAKLQYKFQSYARVRRRDGDRATSDAEDHLDHLPTFLNIGGSTIQEYKEKYNLSIGLYVQEFAIDDAIIDLLVKYVNMYSDVYDLGLSWGGVNGVTVRGIQPGRFTRTDGFWNQRYIGKCWDVTRYPSTSTTQR